MSIGRAPSLDAAPPFGVADTSAGSSRTGYGPRRDRLVDPADVAAYLERLAATIARHRAYLDSLDAALGDGDHGENMATGCRAALRDLAERPEEDLGALLHRVGHSLIAHVGGASGPLYGTAFVEAGFLLEGRRTLDLAGVADAFEAACRGLARRGRCAVGDKTILDALAPAAAALRAAADGGASLEDGLRAAALAARDGMRATVPLVARRGLALRLGERSRGHQDPGATSCFLLIRAMLSAAPQRPHSDAVRAS